MLDGSMTGLSVFSTATGELRCDLRCQSSLRHARFSPCGDFIVGITAYEAIYFWSARSWSSLGVSMRAGSEPRDVAWFAGETLRLDSRSLVVGGLNFF